MITFMILLGLAGVVGMALVKFGNGVSAMSGKVAGNVFARNKAGAYIRNWAKPTSTPTISQTQNRARFGNQSAGWGALSSAQRDGWNAAAQGTQLLNRLGDPYVPTGRQMFLASNNQLAAAATAVLTDAPADFVPPTISAALTVTTTEDGAGGFVAMNLSITGVDATKKYVVEATPQMPNIKQNLTNVYRQIGVFAGSAAVTNLIPSFEALYGPTAVVGNVIWFRIKTVDVANGMASSDLIVQSVIAP